MPIYDLQASFVGGEISPETQGRVDIEKYKKSTAKLRNFIPSPRGPISNRQGTHFIAATKYGSSKKCRIEKFSFSTTDNYVLEIGDKYIRFYKNGAQVLFPSPSPWVTSHAYVPGNFVEVSSVAYYCLISHTSGTFATDLAAGKWVAQSIYEVPTPYLEADLPLLKFAPSADTVFIAHQSYAPMKLQRSSDISWSLSAFVFKNGPFMFPNTDTASTLTFSDPGLPGFVNILSSKSIFDAGHVNSWWEVKVPFAAAVDGGSTTAGTNTYTINCGSVWRLTTTGTWQGNVVVRLWDGASFVDINKYVSGGSDNFNVFNSVDLIDGYIPPTVQFIVTVVSGTCVANVTSDSFVGKYYMEIASVSDAAHAQANFGTRYHVPPTYAVAFSQWSEGSFSTFRGWPGIVSFFQDRLIFASTPAEPQTEWMSQTSDYPNFGTSSVLVDSDSIGVNLLSRTLNKIRSLVPFLDSILSFTDSSEWNVTSTSGGPITPFNVQSRLQGVRGSSDLDPIMIGNRIIFIEPRGASVRDMVYEYLANNFNSENISVASNHLLSNPTTGENRIIVSWAYQQEPDSLLWAVTDDGILLCLTYMREQEVLAWSWHDTGGTVESICVIPNENTDQGDDLWLVVSRNSNRYIERMTRRVRTTAPEDQYFVDCGITYDGSPTTTVSGLSHLNGKTVAINADGFVLPQQIVSGGTITLSIAASKVHVGLPYFADLQTLCSEFQVRDGSTIQGRKYQINRTVVRYLNSRGGWIGSDENTLDEIDHRLDLLSATDAADTTIPTPLFTGFDPRTLRPGDDSHPTIFFRQIDPMPVTIMSITSVIDPGTDA